MNGAFSAGRAARKAVLVDLAGVLLDPAPGPDRPPGLRSGAGAALRLLDRLDYRLIVLATCLHDRRQAGHTGQARAADLLARERVILTGFWGCTAHGPACIDCPPAPGMLKRAARRFDIALGSSWLLGQGACFATASRSTRCGMFLIGVAGGERPWQEPGLEPEMESQVKSQLDSQVETQLDSPPESRMKSKKKEPHLGQWPGQRPDQRPEAMTGHGPCLFRSRDIVDAALAIARLDAADTPD